MFSLVVFVWRVRALSIDDVLASAFVVCLCTSVCVSEAASRVASATE